MRKFIFIWLLLFISCHNDKTDLSYFNAVKVFDQKLTIENDEGWLATQNEKGQTFAQYKNIKFDNQKVDSSVSIYLIPYGDFTDEEMDVIKNTANYLSTFYQRNVVIKETQSDNTVPDTVRREGFNGYGMQLKATYFIKDLLLKVKEKNAIATLAICKKDLYPYPGWNFVFGLSSYTDRVGVVSIQRLKDPSNKFLERLAKIASHEIGHTQNLHHCIHAKCVMNGTNGLYETDQMPMRLCSECQQKIHWKFQYNNKKRLLEIMNYCKTNNLNNDYLQMKKDYDYL
jgi:archaemetzincin